MIRFMAPDLPHPSGGLKAIHRFVERLVDSGHDARVWHGTPGLGYAELGSGAPVETGLRLDFAPGDLLVMPETRGTRWRHLSAGQPVVVLCQGVDFVFADADFTEDLPGGYPGWPEAAATIAASESIRAFLQRACAPGFPVHHVPVEIEAYFRPLPKERVLSLMPRRRREDVLAAVQLIRRSGRLGDWTVLPIDGMTQPQVAEALGRSAVFLFGGEREGFGLPGAEAMAAGAYVVGFTGDGAKEYLLPDCSTPVADSDVVGMAEAALAAMRTFEDDPAALAATVEVGRRRLHERHSAEQVRAALDDVVTQLLDPAAGATFTRATTVSHYQAHATPRGWRGAYARGRHVAGRVRDRVRDRVHDRRTG